MSHRALRAILAALAVLAPALALAAPLRAQAGDSLSLDLTLGASAGSGSRRHYNDTGGIAAEATLGFRPHPDHERSWMAALVVGGRASLDFGDATCQIEPGTASGCAPAFPDFAHLGLLGGLEWRRSAMALRALAGPALYGGGGEYGAGAQLHLDAAAGFRHVALVVAARGSLVARFDGERLLARSLELGLRVQ